MATILGRDMGGCRTYGGRKTYQRKRSPENFWTPPKELLVCSVLDFCTGKNRALTPEGGAKRTVRGGVQNLFCWRGVIREVFHPLFFPPPPRLLTIHFLLSRACCSCNCEHFENDSRGACSMHIKFACMRSPMTAGMAPSGICLQICTYYLVLYFVCLLYLYAYMLWMVVPSIDACAGLTCVSKVEPLTHKLTDLLNQQ